MCDWFLGVKTIDCEGMRTRSKGRFADAFPYGSTHHFTLYWHLRRMKLKSDDVFFDIGCGAGRLVCLAARLKIRKVVGIELDSELAALARQNVGALRNRRCPVEVMCGDAATADYGEGTAFFLNNPFGSDTVRAVLEAIRDSLIAARRRTRIVYMHPVHHRVLEECGWLRARGEFYAPLSSAVRFTGKAC